AAFAKGPKAEGVMPFGEADRAIVGHERTVIIFWDSFAERAEKQNLPEGGFDQIGAAHDFGDLHRRIIHGAGELVTGDVVFSPHEEVAEIAAGGGALWAETTVVENDFFLGVGHAKPPVDRDRFTERRQRRVDRRTEILGIDRLIINRWP